MKPAVKYAVMGGGALVLLFGSFATFAALSGQPLHKVALLKYFVSAPADSKDESTATREPAPAEGAHPAPAEGAKPPVAEGAPAATTEEQTKAVEKTISVLGAFAMPSGFSVDELVDIQGELRKSTQEAKALLTRLKTRERDLDDREKDIEQRQKELSAMQKHLADKESELGMLKAEVDRDASAREERETASWKELSKFFEEGDVATLSKNLLSFSPKEAAKILRSLDDERASSLVNSLPTDKYAEYIQEYRAQGLKAGAKKKP
jgi:flagellar motility protein MotE (MotC chaperone)